MLRVRFEANKDDYRPINWPVKYPYWCSGYTDDHNIVITYADSEGYVYQNWPEAQNLDIEERETITFTDRFPKPEWFDINNIIEQNFISEEEIKKRKVRYKIVQLTNKKEQLEYELGIVNMELEQYEGI